MQRFELRPTNSQKSFYGKAIVEVADDGTMTLYSYNVPIMQEHNGKYERIHTEWSDTEEWSATTGKHIKAFCGMDKARFMALGFKEV